MFSPSFLEFFQELQFVTVSLKNTGVCVIIHSNGRLVITSVTCYGSNRQIMQVSMAASHPRIVQS